MKKLSGTRHIQPAAASFPAHDTLCRSPRAGSRLPRKATISGIQSISEIHPDTASVGRPALRAHAYRPPNAITLVRAYRWFVRVSDPPGIISRRVPRTPAGRTRFLKDELGTWAYGGLITIIPPRTDGARALLMVTVPDLVFARLDRIEPTQLLRRLDPAVLDRWRETSRQLALDAQCKLALTIP